MTQSLEMIGSHLTFPDGLPGFTHLGRFQILQEEKGTPFFSLRSLEDEQVGFWLVDPFPFFPHYEFTLQDSVKAQLQLEEATPLSVRNIITVRDNGEVTVNLKAPIIINETKLLAKQVILNGESYEIRQPLFHMQDQSASK
jgi:flagellar assembly factor FliW